MALGVNVAIGSDKASSGIVDMTQEVRLACCCYKGLRLNRASCRRKWRRWRRSTAPRLPDGRSHRPIEVGKG
jgi:hypothetical protein